MNQHTPEHERLLLEISDETFHLWRHSPITAAYLLYLGDQIQAFREAAMDLLEAGHLAPQADVIQGRIATLRELQSLTLGAIQNFYRKEDKDENHADSY